MQKLTEVFISLYHTLVKKCYTMYILKTLTIHFGVYNFCRQNFRSTFFKMPIFCYKKCVSRNQQNKLNTNLIRRIYKMFHFSINFYILASKSIDLCYQNVYKISSFATLNVLSHSFFLKVGKVFASTHFS